MKFRPPGSCPVCGEDVPPRAAACPGCGADERAGWNDESAYLDGVDLPEPESGGDGEESYEQFMEREFGVGRAGRWFRALVFVFLVLALAVYFLRRH